MKRVYKRYKTGKKGGQHYHVRRYGDVSSIVNGRKVSKYMVDFFGEGNVQEAVAESKKRWPTRKTVSDAEVEMLISEKDPNASPLFNPNIKLGSLGEQARKNPNVMVTDWPNETRIKLPKPRFETEKDHQKKIEAFKKQQEFNQTPEGKEQLWEQEEREIRRKGKQMDILLPQMKEMGLINEEQYKKLKKDFSYRK